MRRFLSALLLLVLSSPAGAEDWDWMSGSLSDIRAGLRTIVAPDTVDLYVDPATGSDSNPGTQAAPFASLQGAISDFPLSWRRKVRVHLAAGTYTLPDQFSWYVGVPSGVTEAGSGGTPVSGTAPYPDVQGGGGRDITFIGTYATLYTGTITSITNTGGGATYQVTDTGQTWTPNALEGAIVRYTDGTASGMTFRIRDNTATMVEALTVNPTPNPSVGDHFVIEEPSVVVQYRRVTVYGTQSVFDVGLSFSGIKFVNTVAGNMSFFQTSVFMTGVTFDNTAGGAISFYKSDVRLGGNATTDTDLDGIQRLRLGVYAYQTDFSIESHSTSFRGIYMVMRGANARVNVRWDSSIWWSALDADGIQYVKVESRSAMWINASTSSGFSSFRLTGCTNATGALRAASSSVIEQQAGIVTITGSTGSAVYADLNSFLNLGAVTGTVNTGYGVDVQHFSRAVITSATTVPGTLGNARAGATAGTYAGIVGGTPLVEVKSQTAIIPST